VLKEKGIELNSKKEDQDDKMKCGCPSSMMKDLREEEQGSSDSELKQWPIQLHLVSPNAPYFSKADLLIAADCTAFSLGSFHQNFLKGKSLVIACPKLDTEQDIYKEKITALIDKAKVNTITVLRMEVPCCGGLVSLSKEALDDADRKIPLKEIVVGINGEIKKEEWI